MAIATDIHDDHQRWLNLLSEDIYRQRSGELLGVEIAPVSRAIDEITPPTEQNDLRRGPTHFRK